MRHLRPAIEGYEGDRGDLRLHLSDEGTRLRMERYIEYHGFADLMDPAHVVMDRSLEPLGAWKLVTLA